MAPDFFFIIIISKILELQGSCIFLIIPSEMCHNIIV